MSKQLGINPDMDKIALDNGLGHWSCVSKRNNRWWVRVDGLEYTYLDEFNPLVNELRLADNIAPIKVVKND